ncbi:hypothetical protein BGZ68_004942 [Mortierella alpina]|nr:hypothetical protein BGZ68_004942 [Mortierella alpina]
MHCSPEPAATAAAFAIVAPFTETVAAQIQALVVLRAVGTAVALDEGIAANTNKLAKLAELERFFVRKADAFVHFIFELNNSRVPRWGGKDDRSNSECGKKTDAVEFQHVESRFYMFMNTVACVSGNRCRNFVEMISTVQKAT